MVIGCTLDPHYLVFSSKVIGAECHVPIVPATLKKVHVGTYLDLKGTPNKSTLNRE